MKTRFNVIAALMVFIFAAAGTSIAADVDHSSHGHDMKSMEKMDTMDSMEDMPAMGDMTHGSPKGDLIRETEVEGYHLAYQLIDMQEQIRQMKAAGHTHEMNMTHHLMVYVTDAAGSPVEKATVGYLVENPDGQKQKLMCMAMESGFGADINFASSGTYEVKTKIAMGDKTIMDAFEYVRP